MPGKVNPVIPEFVVSAVHKVYANDLLISNLCGQGCLDLNAYLPTIGHALLDSIKLLIGCNKTIKQNLVQGLDIVKKDAETDAIYTNPSVATALIPYIGYHNATELALCMKKNKLTIFQANDLEKRISSEQLESLMKPEALVRQGYSLNDLT